MTTAKKNSVEQHGEDHDAERAGERRVERVHRAQPGQPFEDLRAEAGAVDVGGDGRDADEHLRGDAHAGEDQRPGQRQSHFQQDAGPAMPIPRPASTMAASTPRSPATVFLMIGRNAYAVSATSVDPQPSPVSGMSRVRSAREGTVRIAAETASEAPRAFGRSWVR